MPTGVEYEILPIEGREEAQKFAAKLPSKAEKFNNKKISLNERIGVLEMGYYLNPTKIRTTREDKLVRFTLKGKDSLTKDQFVQKQKALEEEKRKKLQEKEDSHEEEDKENAPKSNNKKRVELEPSDKLTPEAYFNEIKQQLAV